MTQEAKEIRKELKALGIKPSQVSVTSDYSSVNVRIKDLSINIEPIKTIAKKYESVRYCEYSQEILSGGNTFVFVEYDWEAIRALRNLEQFKKKETEITPLIEALTNSSGVEIAPGFVVFRSNNYGGYQATIEGEENIWTHFSNIPSIVEAWMIRELQGKNVSEINVEVHV
jgi:hypothetical protein